MFITLFSASAFAYILILISLLFVLFEEAVYGRPERTGSFIGADSAVYPYGGLSSFAALVSAVLFCISFYFIPMGSLPSFAHPRHNILFLYASLFAALLFTRFRSTGRHRSALSAFLSYDGVKFLFLLTVVLLLFVLFASRYGIPGELLSFETYAAPLLFGSAGPFGKAAFVLFALCLAAFAPSGEKRGPLFLRTAGMFEALVYPALIAALFVPVNAGLSLGLFGLPLFAADLLLFWVKVFLIKELLMPCMRFLLRPVRETLYASVQSSGRAALLFCVALLLFAWDIYRIL